MNVVKTEHIFAWQREQRALYAKVAVEVSGSTESKWHLHIPDSIPSTWQTAITFGFEIFVERLSQTERRLARNVKIVEMDGQPCDTTMTVIAYTTFVALAKTLKTKIEKPLQFNEVDGHFTF